MKRELKQVCGVCGEVYFTVDAANVCLDNHPEIGDVTEVSWSKELNIPSQVEITFSDGRTFVYYMKNEVKPKVVKEGEEFLWW